jgi:hypothetical protein
MRNTRPNLSLTGDVATTPLVAVGPYKDCLISVLTTPSSAARTLRFAVQSNDGETPHVLYNASNTVVEMTVAPGRAYALPSELAAAAFVKVFHTGAGVVTATIDIKA